MAVRGPRTANQRGTGASSTAAPRPASGAVSRGFPAARRTLATAPAAADPVARERSISTVVRGIKTMVLNSVASAAGMTWEPP